MTEPSDLEVLRSELSILLVDVANIGWDTDLLDQAIRIALADLGSVLGTAQTIAGLDGAEETTVETIDLACLQIGAAAYAARARALDLSEKVSLGQGPQTTMVEYGRDMLAQFRILLGRITQRLADAAVAAAAAAEQSRLSGMRTSSSAPYGRVGWDLEANIELQATYEEEEVEPAEEADIMQREARNITTVVTVGSALSGVIDSTWAAAQGLKTPAVLDANTKIAFMVAESAAGTFLPLYDDEFNQLVELTVNVGEARSYALPDKIFAWPYFKLWCENAGSDVNQIANRTFIVVQKS